MPIRPTVFIVGAGASSEVGLPIGSTLRKTIAKKVDIKFEDGHKLISGDRSVAELLELLDGRRDRAGINPYLYAGRNIAAAMRSGLAGSIDTYLDHHVDNRKLVEVGKIGIAASIIEAEALSSLKYSRHGQPPELQNVADTWFPLFLNLVGTAVRADNLEALFVNTTIICFNYDRCIEHFLYHAIQAKFLCDQDRAQVLVSKLSIHHPYGTVGSLPWQRKSGPSIGFGEDNNHALDAALSIRTFTEQWEDKEALDQIHTAIANAQALVFLGFGFVPQNLELLRIRSASKATDVFLTARGISESDRKHVTNRIRACFFGGIGAQDPRFHVAEECRDMFAQHYHGLLHFVTS